MIAAREFLGTFLVHCIQLTHLESQQQLLNAGDNKLSPFDHATKQPHFRPYTPGVWSIKYSNENEDQ